MYKNFKVALYLANFDFQAIKTEEGKKKFETLLSHIDVSKIYLETYRNALYTEAKLINELKAYFASKNITVSGGITFTQNGKNEFESFCYSHKESYDEAMAIVRFTAQHFDEFILDDFFFTNCKCSLCIKKKNDLSWAEYRLDLMEKVSRDVVKVAKEVNENVHVIIKYPNWYDSYQTVGYNVEKSSEIFDSIYTGTETRMTSMTQQTLPAYNSYFLMRYLENVKPGHNLGGWFDSIDCKGDLNSYLDQLYLTLLANAKEVTLFSLGMLLNQDDIFVALAGYGFNKIEGMLNQFGHATGVAAYKPHGSRGESHLYGVLGMMGMPIECYPVYPKHKATILLTESAIKDLQLMNHIKESMKAGQRVILTSGLLEALNESSSFDDISQIKVKQDIFVSNEFAHTIKECAFKTYAKCSNTITFKAIDYSTNDVWQEIVGRTGGNNLPVLMKLFFDEGEIYILNVPCDHTQLKELPISMIDHLRMIVCKDQPVLLRGPSDISLFTYDNKTMVVRSFINNHSTCEIVVKDHESLHDLDNNIYIEGFDSIEGTVFNIDLEPRSMRSFEIVTRK